ncbi:hypothetical protein LOTGIDRAFT_230310 [Lottia gigantea]|uniref:CFA20 domain-containing protein n=1 Tax=Lottia gigantea TaxID=225164 RepID=V4CNT3_LOTGI|nr:hypothetical protein LOTGIDRAFT_230310 [Lottia gigantea]ESP04065.1 hypothetical protein LOTGIDRAFT_230310 [Lottia gigantea]
MAHLWQHPYVNVFKHFNLSTWKKSTKEGEVSTAMDKTLKGTVFRITGSIPAGNYIQLPKTGSQSLGLTGRYMYLMFRPIPAKYFVVHVDVATQDNLVVRVSFSNLFKEFKSTSTCLQFPFICHASKGSISSLAAVGAKAQIGPTPLSARWTVLSLDFQYILSTYLNRKYHFIKSIRLCANMIVKNIYTSDMVYDPGISFSESKKRGMIPGNAAPMPREMAFPLLKGSDWHEVYDIIRFPADSEMQPFDSIQFSDRSKTGSIVEPARQLSKTVDVSKCVSDRVTMINKVTAPREKKVRKTVRTELPEIGTVDTWSVTQDNRGDVHLFAKTDDDVVVHRDDKYTGREITRDKVKPPAIITGKKTTYTQLEPDPILKLKKIVGFGGGTFKEVLWAQEGTTVVYPCYAVVVAMKVDTGTQRFFIGHTDKISAVAITGNSSLLASGQTGSMSLVRVWRFHNAECLSMCKTHAHSLHSLSFSSDGNVLCGVGKDGQGKNMVVIWDCSKVLKHREMSVLAKAHTDVDIARMKIAPFDNTRMVSCGKENIRLWRVKEGSLRSAPVNLTEHHNMDLTDICFEACVQPDRESANKLLYACSKSGHILKIDYKKVTVQHVRRLLPVSKKTDHKDIKVDTKGTGICINSMYVSEAFCVTGSDDGFLRLWPLDFAHVYLEAEHEGPVTAVNLSADGLKILAGTITGNIGILDVSTRGYSTIMRSHTSSIYSVAIDPYRKHIATVSQDKTIRVWDAETLQQLYDFSSAKECPCTISYHPLKQVFACGFENGIIRIFNVSTTTMLAEHKQHNSMITGLVYNPKGDYLYSCDSLGTLVLYDITTDTYSVNRVLTNTVARGERYSPNALTVCPDGSRVAFIGPSDFTVTVVEGKSLDEVLRIDVTNMYPTDTRTSIDTAVQVSYSTTKLHHLLVTTANNKLLKFDARNGRLLTEMDHIHRSGCTSISVYDTGKYLATAGDKVIKIWDYEMKLDINFQVFIGHCEKINRILFTPDGIGFISVGEAIYIWDFLAFHKPPPSEGRDVVLDKEQEELIKEMERLNNSMGKSFTEVPRRSPPRPTIRFDSPGRIDDLSSIYKSSVGDIDDIQSVTSEKEEVILGPELEEVNQQMSSDEDRQIAVIRSGNQVYTNQQTSLHSPRHVTADSGNHIIITSTTVPKPNIQPKPSTNKQSKPTVYKHYKHRPTSHGIAQRRYTAPPNQAGLRLSSVIGYNGNGRNNMIWQQDTGLFAYTCGSILIIEDLNTSEQRHLQGHTEEISTIALQNDYQVIASASGGYEGVSPSQICIWDIKDGICKKTLSHHEYDIVCMTYSRDDRFLVSVGDYRECNVVLWSTNDYSVLATTTTDYPIHDIQWDPSTVNEFSTVGENATVLFWLLDETVSEVALNVHVADVPGELVSVGGKAVSFTALEFGNDSTLYIGTSHGKITAWDTRQNSCFMLWDGDDAEIDLLLCNGNKLLTGSCNNNVKLWSLDNINDIKQSNRPPALQHGLTLEDEMTLNGIITCAVFDPNMEMGIVGTGAGTLWYINWSERTSLRLVSGHMNKINGMSICNNGLLATGGDDGSVRVLTIKDREQALQFQVLDQKCTCLSFAPPSQQSNQSIPNIAAGFSDGTVRMFDVNKVEMVLKMQPHGVSVTAISFSSDGRMIISGSQDGILCVSSITTGLTEEDTSVNAPLLWLASSNDRRVSVWSADWSRDFCELVDWLTFPAPAFTPDGSIIDKNNKGDSKSFPPTLACFSKEESDIILYVGYGMQKNVQFYSLSQRKVVRTAALTHWATSLDVSPDSSLIAIGINERLLKLLDYFEGSFQDFTGHSDSVSHVNFHLMCSLILAAGYSDILMWEVAL